MGVFLVINDGRHRVCAMERQTFITEVTVNCGSITNEDVSKLSNADTGNLKKAEGACRRSKDLYDAWVDEENKIKAKADAEARQKAEKERREKYMQQANAG